MYCMGHNSLEDTPDFMSAIESPISEPKLALLNARAQVSNGVGQLSVHPAEGESRLVFASDPGGIAAEQYRLVRRKLMEKYPEGGAVVVTSPEMGEGKTLTSANLAWCFAEIGVPTLLAEMDLRNPSLSKLFGYSPQIASIASLLSDADPVKGAVYQINNLSLYAAMSDARHSTSALLTSDRLARFVAWAKQNYKW